MNGMNGTNGISYSSDGSSMANRTPWYWPTKRPATETASLFRVWGQWGEDSTSPSHVRSREGNAADLRRDLLARGLSVEEIECLVRGEAAEPRAHAEATALANAIANMVHDSELDQDAVVGLLEVFLKRERTMQNRWGQTKHAQQAAEAAQSGSERDNGTGPV
jgi:hypothetical protein